MSPDSSPRLKVLDLTDRLAFNAARLFVGLGADVVRIERAGTPRLSPLAAAHWHAGKRLVHGADSVTADWVLALAGGADVVLESGPVDELITPRLRIDHAAAFANAVHVVVTPFGLTGPQSHWRGGDAVVAAAGGMTWMGGDADGPPEPPPCDQPSQLAGSHAAIAAMVGVVAGHRGSLIDISAQEVTASTLETGAIAWIHGATVPRRSSGVYQHVAHRVFEARDGYVAGGYSGSGRMWDDLLTWMVEEDAAEDLDDPKYQDVVARWTARPHVDEVVARFVASRPAESFAAEARSRALPWAEVVPPTALFKNPQLKDREFFLRLSIDDESIQDVGFPFASPGLPRPVSLSAMEPVETAAWRDSGPEAPTALRRSPGGTGPLSGLRVLDLTWVLAGPYMTRYLADQGAEVIKVESIHRQDPTRFSPGMRLRPGAGHDESGYFLNFNRNKKSIALNLKTEQGRDLLQRLAFTCDMVVENFSPGVLQRWGIDYPRLSQRNPGVIVVSMAGLGQTGPWRDAVTFADTLAAMSGLTFETGRGRSAPQGLTFGLGDMVAANAAALAALDLLARRAGGHVDLAQLEAMAAHLSTAALQPDTDRRRSVFRVKGEDHWIAIEPADVEAAAGALTTGGDCSIQALELALSRLDGDDAAKTLQGAGLAAYAVRDGRTLVELDEQLAARGFWQAIEHPLAGSVLHDGPTFRFPGDDMARQPAPLLGQHTDEILMNLLGMAADDVRGLRDQGVLE